METYSVVLPGSPIWIALAVLAVVIAVGMLSRGRNKKNSIGAIFVLIILGASAGVVYYVSNPRPAAITLGKRSVRDIDPGNRHLQLYQR